VRAYVPQLDPHGAWAPIEEESSIYDLDLEFDPPPRLWEEMTRTALGVRIDRGALPPLRDHDVVVRVDGVPLAGMSVEQANQLAYVTTHTSVPVVVLREGSPVPLRLEVAPRVRLLEPPPDPSSPPLSTHRVPYGDEDALVVRVDHVPDDLGERLSETLRLARHRAPIAGVLLDLRGNGGGSTEGALGALGLFLPGASLFPMRRRDGAIEIDRAPTPGMEHQWDGPVAALVDGDSASAAEMLAGALAAYERGLVLGSRTYGKGCAQEYLDDEAGVGVLRLTTLVFSLPDGSALQQVGVAPDIVLGTAGPFEREALLPHAPASWRGPDVRDRRIPRGPSWPPSGGRIGQAPDPVVHRALRALDSRRTAAKR
jgi:carboxyl-terminal processing protease